MQRFIFGVLTFIIFGCSIRENMTQQQMDPAMPVTASLPDLGPAPELTNDTWLNVDSPLRLADLRGKVVIVEMWTFGCINCQHVMPALKEWHSKYKFSYEADLENLKEAIAQNDIQYAVAQDNDGATWKAYKNHYWPALYLIDKQGNIRYVHIGEGRYSETEKNIKALLEETY